MFFHLLETSCFFVADFPPPPFLPPPPADAACFPPLPPPAFLPAEDARPLVMAEVVTPLPGELSSPAANLTVFFVVCLIEAKLESCFLMPPFANALDAEEHASLPLLLLPFCAVAALALLLLLLLPFDTVEPLVLLLVLLLLLLLLLPTLPWKLGSYMVTCRPPVVAEPDLLELPPPPPPPPPSSTKTMVGRGGGRRPRPRPTAAEDGGDLRSDMRTPFPFSLFPFLRRTFEEAGKWLVS